MPRRCMSSVKDVIVSSCAIFGSLTNVPAPVSADEEPFADEVVERRTDREAGDAEITAQLALGGDRLPHAELLDQVEHPARAPRSASSRPLAPPAVAIVCSVPVEAVILSSARLWSRPPFDASAAGLARRLRARASRARGRSRDRRSGTAPVSTASSRASPCRRGARVDAGGEERRLADASRASSARPRPSPRPAGAASTRKHDMRVRAELLEDVDRDARSAEGPPARAPASSNASGRMPSTTRPARAGGRRAGSSGSACCPKRDDAVLDRRLDEVHRRRADEGGDEDVARAARRAPAAGRPGRPPVAHHGDALPERHRLGLVVRDVDRRHAEPGVELRERRAHPDAELRVEVRERLVHQERARLAHDRAAHRDALALAAGQLRRLAVEQLLEARGAPRPRRPARATRPSARAAP